VQKTHRSAAGQHTATEAFGHLHRGALARIGPIVPDTEQVPAERLAMIHRQYQQRIL
jgi:hypothetical protein